MKEFRFQYVVRLDDLDYMGIVGNAAWLIFLERARAELLEAIGYPMSRFFKEKIGGVVSDLDIKYIRPARYGDSIQIKITGKDPTEISGVLEYTVSTSEDKPLVKANTKMVFVNEAGRPIAMPMEIRAALYD